MNFLSSFLLSLSLNIDTLKVSVSQEKSNIPFNKFKILFAAVFTTIITFMAMALGRIIDIYFTGSLSNIFGAVLLGFVGIYYIVEHIRYKKIKEGYDTSFYVENANAYKKVIEFPNNNTNSSFINIKDIFNICIALSLNNIWPSIAGSLSYISIPETLFFNFIICICAFLIGSIAANSTFLNFICKNHYLISSFILILLSLYECFL